jgi:hypothetical protein
MIRARLRSPLLLLCAAVLAALALLSPSARAQSSVIANAPIKNFRLPSFNDAGNRTSLLRGSEGRYIDKTQIDIVGLNFAQFLGDGSTDTSAILLAPSATVFIKENNRVFLTGHESMRLIHESFEASGDTWTYDHTGRHLTLTKNVRVVFHTRLKGILN